MNKVIFLDVDGVLNNGTWAIEMFDKGIRVYHDDLLYEPSLEQLKRIVDSTGAVIVVSSSWRQIPIAYLHLKEWLEKYGMEIHDKTPYSFFSVIPNGITDIEGLLAKVSVESVRYIIRKEIRWDVRDMLDQFNVNDRIIYPGLDGICKWLGRHYFVRGNRK